MQAFLAELTPKSQNSAAHPETLHELQAGALTQRAIAPHSLQGQGTSLFFHALLWAVSVIALHLLSQPHSSQFSDNPHFKTLNMVVIPTEAVRSFSSFNWIGLMHIAPGYSIHKPTVRGCPDTRIWFLIAKAQDPANTTTDSPRAQLFVREVSSSTLLTAPAPSL